MEFKGTQGEWTSVFVPATKYITERYEVQYGKDGECVAEFVHNEHDSKLIAASPDLLEELNETIIDLKILKDQISDALKTNHLFDGMPELIEKWIERKTQLIKEATEL